MTQSAQQPEGRCDHECVCFTYHYGNDKGKPCLIKTCGGNYGCTNDTRSRPHTSTPPHSDKFCDYQDECARTTSATCEYCDKAYSNMWKQHDTAIRTTERNAVLDDIWKFVCAYQNKGVVKTINLQVHLESLRTQDQP